MPATAGNAINVTAAGLVKFDGTATFASTAITQHDVLVGGASNSITSVGVGATGTVLIGNTGADPSFSAAPTLTSVNFGGATLSNYSTGTWTPTLYSDSGGSTTYTTQDGYYVRVGNLVWVLGVVGWSAWTAGTGVVNWGGLPFAVSSSAQSFPAGHIWMQGFTYTGQLVPIGRTTLTSGYFYQVGSAATPTLLPVANINTGGGSYYITMVYSV